MVPTFFWLGGLGPLAVPSAQRLTGQQWKCQWPGFISKLALVGTVHSLGALEFMAGLPLQRQPLRERASDIREGLGPHPRNSTVTQSQPRRVLH